MTRSTKDAWLEGSGDLEEDVVEDVPVKGESVLVRALPASVSAQVQQQMRLETNDREQVAKFDIAEMEILQFAHGVIEPKFDEREARIVAEKYGRAFKKVIARIDELSGVDKEAIEKTEQRFPVGGDGPNGSGGRGAGAPVGVAGPAGLGTGPAG